MLQYKNVWGGDTGPMPSIRNDYEYAKLASYEDTSDSHKAFSFSPTTSNFAQKMLHFLTAVNIEPYGLP